MGVLKGDAAQFFRDGNAHKSTGKQSNREGKQSKSWSKSEGKGKSKENKGKSKGKSKGTESANQGVKGSHKVQTSRTGLSGFENSKSEASSETQDSAQTCTTDVWNDGWSFQEWNDDWSSVGWHEGWEPTYDTSASSFSLGGFDVSATSSPKRFEWVKMHLDTGAAVNTFPLNFGPEGARDGRFYRTASGKWISDGGALHTRTWCSSCFLAAVLHLSHFGLCFWHGG